MSNASAINFLEHWLSIENSAPGYAVLIAGAWGCGKTHIVKSAIAKFADNDALYVSLYGVSSTDDLEKAMARSLYPKSESQAAKFGQQAKNLLSAVRIAGVSVDLNSVSLTEIALMGLPRVLVFDDLERADMDLRPLLGTLNKFVEHERRTVVLIGAEDILRENHSHYDREKEKICGRTVFIEPEVERVLPALWGGRHLACFQAHQADIVEVFQASECQSLRVLNQTLREFARVLDVLNGASEIVEHKLGFKMFLRTYFALSLAYLSGKITAQDIAGRGVYDTLRVIGEGASWTTLPLGYVADKHQREGIYAEGSVLSVPLGIELIAKAHSPKWMIETLRQNQFFVDDTKDAESVDWMTLLNWRATPSHEIDAALKRVNEALSNHEITNTGEIVKTFSALAWLAENNGIVQTEEQVFHEALKYVESLSQQDAIAPRRPDSSGRTNEGYDFSLESGRVSYSGYSVDITEQNQPLIEVLKTAQDEALARHQPEYTQDICDLLTQKTEEVLHRLEGRSRINWIRNAFLQFSDPEQIAQAFVEAWKAKPRTCGMIIENFASRWRGNPSILELEKDWALKWRVHLCTKASAERGVLSAQIQAAVRSELTLLEDDESENE